MIEGHNCTIQQLCQILSRNIGSLVINFSYLFPSRSLLGSYCVSVSVMALLRIRILYDDLNEEYLMKNFLTGFGTGFRNKQGNTELLRNLQRQKSHWHPEFSGKRV